jgi:hypothetical protein
MKAEILDHSTFPFYFPQKRANIQLCGAGAPVLWHLGVVIRALVVSGSLTGISGNPMQSGLIRPPERRNVGAGQARG